MRKIKLLEEYAPIAQFFGEFEKETDTVFLDSSLKNEMGRYSILGRNPYLKLVNIRSDIWRTTEKKMRQTCRLYREQSDIFLMNMEEKRKACRQKMRLMWRFRTVS